MKKLLRMVVLGSLICNISIAKTYTSEIFGVKILDNVKNYIETCEDNGVYILKENCESLLIEEWRNKKKYENYINTSLIRSSIKAMRDLKQSPKLNIKFIKNPMFNSYNLSLDKEFNIVQISGSVEISDQNIESFNNKCRKQKKNLRKRVSEIHNIPITQFGFSNYKIISDEKPSIGNVDAAEVIYKYKDEPIVLRISCYYLVYEDYTKIKTMLSYRLYTLEFWETQMRGLKKRGYIRKDVKNLSDEEIVTTNKGL